jgi:hypothetical protein
VTEAPPERSGLLVVRVWVEPEQPGLRARLTRKLNLLSTAEEVSAAGSAEEIRAQLDAFLREFLARAGVERER